MDFTDATADWSDLDAEIEIEIYKLRRLAQLRRVQDTNKRVAEAAAA